jgi:hypothetical protein
MKIIALISALYILSACSHNSLKIENGDKYFEEITKSFENKKTESNFLDWIKEHDQKTYNQILLDSTNENVAAFWGESLNFDSGAKQTILNELIIRDLQAAFNIKNDNKVVNAGIMHSYGYLYSILETPYGYKRKRWIDPTISYGFNLEKKSISSNPLEGTLLSNLTFFAGKILFKHNVNKQNLLKLKNVSNEIVNFPYDKLKIVTLVEEVTNSKEFPLIFKTCLVKLQNKSPGEENDYLLVYGVENMKTSKEVIITAFPIKKDAYIKTLDPVLLGEDRPIIVRYNGFVGTNKETRLSGKRLILGLD